MALRTLGTRIAVSAGLLTVAGIAVLSTVLVREQRGQIREEAVLGSQAIASSILLSLEHATRTNQREYLAALVQSAGEHEWVEGVRLFNAEGVIAFSSRPREVGERVDMQAEACVDCHSGSVPVASLDPRQRTRMFKDEHGHTVVGNTAEVRNRVGCQGSQCHVAPEEQRILGVLDVLVQLDAAEVRIARSTREAIAISFFAVFFITLAIFFLVRESIRRPIRKMVEVTSRVAGGELQAEVPTGSSAEMDFLAGSLNEMIESFSTSQNRLEDWAAGLEDTVSRKAEELRRSQMEVAQAEKLSSVGMVAAGIAHELNSPLMAIITFAHLVQEKVESGSREHDDLQMIIAEANRCAGIIRQLLDFSREQADPVDREPCNVRDVVESAAKILKVEFRNRGVDLEVDLVPDLPPVEANRAQLMQVLVNLMMNSLHAMPGGGVVTVSADVVERSSFAGALMDPHPGEGLVRIRVRDTGEGIDRNALNRVFDPFYTTKDVGKGSGLGLSVSMGLIQRLHGTILADSDGESWTEFTILIPVPVAPLVGAIR